MCIQSFEPSMCVVYKKPCICSIGGYSEPHNIWRGMGMSAITCDVIMTEWPGDFYSNVRPLNSHKRNQQTLLYIDNTLYYLISIAFNNKLNSKRFIL